MRLREIYSIKRFLWRAWNSPHSPEGTVVQADEAGVSLWPFPNAKAMWANCQCVSRGAPSPEHVVFFSVHLFFVFFTTLSTLDNLNKYANLGGEVIKKKEKKRKNKGVQRVGKTRFSSNFIKRQCGNSENKTEASEEASSQSMYIFKCSEAREFNCFWKRSIRHYSCKSPRDPRTSQQQKHMRLNNDCCHPLGKMPPFRWGPFPY